MVSDNYWTRNVLISFHYTFFNCNIQSDQKFLLFKLNILQPDITWLGGLTEARRVVAMASAYDTMVIPHGSSVFSYHLQFAYLPLFLIF